MTLRLTKTSRPPSASGPRPRAFPCKRRRAELCVSTSSAAATATGSPLQQARSWTCTARHSDVSVSDADIRYPDRLARSFRGGAIAPTDGVKGRSGLR